MSTDMHLLINHKLCAFRIKGHKEGADLHGPQSHCELGIVGVEGETRLVWLSIFVDLCHNLAIGEVVSLPCKLLSIHFLDELIPRQ